MSLPHPTSHGTSKPSAVVSRTTSGSKPSSTRVNTLLGAPRANILPSSSTTPDCECGVPSQRQKVTQKSAREGKGFYACGVGDGCGFFQWCENGSSSLSVDPLPLAPAKRALASESLVSSSLCASLFHTNSCAFNQVGATAHQCQCRIDAVQRTVGKEGPNKGRVFWGCSKGKDDGCGFFEWDDEPNKNLGAAAPRSSSVNQNDPTNGRCFKVRLCAKSKGLKKLSFHVV